MYLQYCVFVALKLKDKDTVLDGEVFNLAPFKHLPEPYKKQQELYNKLSTDSTTRIFKIFPKQLEPKTFGSNEWVSFFEQIHNKPLTSNILLYRENLLDVVFSSIITHSTGIRKTRDPEFYNSTEKLVPTRELIENRIKDTVESIRRLVYIHDNYEFDSIIRYEDFTGNPTLDFDLPLNYLELIDKTVPHPLKMNSFKHKKSILPAESITELFTKELNKYNIPVNLEFKNDGLVNLNLVVNE